MALIQFHVPYAVSWVGKTYQPGLQAIPKDLAVALGWLPPPTEDLEAEKAPEAQRSARRGRPPTK